MKTRLGSFLTGIALILMPTLTLAHPGNTDKYGCHTCKTNCPQWGLKKNEYHCHKSKGLKQPKPSIQSKKLW